MEREVLESDDIDDNDDIGAEDDEPTDVAMPALVAVEARLEGVVDMAGYLARSVLRTSSFGRNLSGV